MAVISGQTVFPLTISGSLADGGYTANFTVVDAADLIFPDQEVMIYIDDKYGPFWTGSTLMFRGYIPSALMNKDHVSGRLDVTAHTADYMLRRLFLPGTAYRRGNNENTKTPSDLRMSYIINNILTRMTNAAQYISWDLEQSPYQIPEYSIDEGDPWSWFEEMAKYEDMMLYFDRSNLMNYRRHPMFLDSPPEAIFEFNEHNMTEIQVEQLDANQVSQVFALGFKQYDTFTALFPDSPLQSGGRLLERKGIPVDSQEQLNDIARRLFIAGNSKYRVTINDVRNHHLELLDIATITHNDPANDIEWDAKRFYVDAVSYAFDNANGVPTLDSSFDLVEIPEELFFNAV